MSNSWQLHGLQHARLPWPSLSLGVCSNSYPLSHWCSLTISSSVTPFSSCLQSLPASGSFPMNLFFASGDQSIGASASECLSSEYSGLISLRWTGFISLLSKGHSRVFSSTTIPNHQFFQLSAFIMVKLLHPYMTTGKIIALTIQNFVGKVMYLLFNMLSRLYIAFLPRIMRLLNSYVEILNLSTSECTHIWRQAFHRCN